MYTDSSTAHLMFQHHPATRLVCVENTHNVTGGKAVSGEWVVQVGHICRARKIPLHCDGARIFNAAVALRDAVINVVAVFPRNFYLLRLVITITNQLILSI